MTAKEKIVYEPIVSSDSSSEDNMPKYTKQD